MPTLADIGEDQLIRRLMRGVKLDRDVIAGAGDDCAVVRSTKHEHTLLKTDALVQDVHFTLDTPPRLIGRKAIARVVSDFAAMGGTPRHAMITLVAPPSMEVKFLTGIYSGMRAISKQYGINIVGGETSRGLMLMLSIAMSGTVPSKRWLSRSQGRNGDALLVTGRLGGSIKGRHLKFEPRLAEGRWLSQHARPHAIMDLSDGLAKDLPRLAEASGLDFSIDPAALPRNRGCTPAQAWGDGEDYELLIAVRPSSVKTLLKRWRAQFPTLPLTVIGHFTKLGKGHRPSFTSTGWDHFALSADA
ncbi:MAG: thiamine-phosphate kinase [Prosthecobacter sp.]|uniref:thiamine-phosphate kinase n=1 Tax=Prosthecobacter sp. TaxID=1965333 RepID=UPI0038FF69E8